MPLEVPDSSVYDEALPPQRLRADDASPIYDEDCESHESKKNAGLLAEVEDEGMRI
jgi:hypothetical protein